jgi:probable rRNA maturation factor
MKKIKSKGLDDTRIFIENEQSELDLKEEHAGLLNKTVLTCLQDENVEIGCEINILITNDASIRQINRQFRNIDRPTDVLSFPIINIKNGRILSEEGDYDMDEGLLLLGDIVISIETAQRQADQYGHPLERELAFLVSHGVFHLLGYDHMEKDEETIMMSKQELVLNKMGLKRI